MEFKDKVAVITGGANGIGRGVAEAFARLGAAIAILDVDLQSAKEAERKIVEQGGRALAIETDVGDEHSVNEAFGTLTTQLGAINVLVNVAGIELYKQFLEISGAEWDRNVAVNLKSVYLCCRQAIPSMIGAGGGSIVSLSSVQALATTGAISSYAAAKGGIISMTRDLARDYGPSHVRVNAVLPGCIDTPMMDRSMDRLTNPQEVLEKLIHAIPLRRIGTPEDIANVVVFLCSSQAAYITGTTITVDGGLMAKLPLPE